jgi:hypothetical protein
MTMPRCAGLLTLATAFAVNVGVPAFAHADVPPPCTNGQTAVTNQLEQSASGHRSVVLRFSLALGGQPCTLTGYPGVDTGEGGPLLHAVRTLSGFGGGLRTNQVPTVTVSSDQPQYAVVEGLAVDKNDADHTCPTYRELVVTPPDTTDASTVPVHIDTCELQVHPMGSQW